MDSFFDELDSTSLLLLFLATLIKGENHMAEENEAIEESVTVEENSTSEEKPEEVLGASIAEPELPGEEVCYIYKSSNRKRLKPRAVYF